MAERQPHNTSENNLSAITENPQYRQDRIDHDKKIIKKIQGVLTDMKRASWSTRGVQSAVQDAFYILAEFQNPYIRYDDALNRIRMGLRELIEINRTQQKNPRADGLSQQLDMINAILRDTNAVDAMLSHEERLTNNIQANWQSTAARHRSQRLPAHETPPL